MKDLLRGQLTLAPNATYSPDFAVILGVRKTLNDRFTSGRKSAPE